MRLEAGLHQRQEMRLRLAPQVIQSIELLQLPLLALEEVVKQELVDNPTLETREDAEEREREEPAAAEETPEAADRLEVLRALESDWQESRGPRAGRGSDADDERRHELLQNTPGRQRTLQDHLLDQLHLSELPSRTQRIAEHLVFNLDAHGGLPYAVDEIVASLPDLFADRPADEAAQEVERVLRLVQSLDPPGVAARDTRECLLLQLKPGDPNYDIKSRMIRNHLDDILENRLPHVAETLDVSIDRCQALVAEIQALNPRPGANFTRTSAPVIMPDVVVRQVGDDYEVILEEHRLPPLMVNPYYIELLQNGKLGGPEKEFIQRKIESGRRLIAAIEHRRLTLTRITREIVRAQREFLDEGIAHLRPMKMQQIADVVNVHVSTVSRAIADKFVQTPRGVFPFKFFFSGATDSAQGESESKVNVLDFLRQIVAGENKANPLSDLDLVRLMRERHGLDLARRTITKYRKALKIPSARKRKQF